MKKLKIGITGSTGYIGSYLKNYLLKSDYEIYDLCRKPVLDNHERFIYFKLGKICDEKKLSQLDALIHCAYDFSVLDYQDIENINVNGSFLLFTQAKNAGVKKIIFLSSVSAFDGAISNYGRGKYALELLAKKMDVMVVRAGLVFNSRPGGIVGAINQLVKKIPLLPLIGKGDQLFFPTHIDDLSKLIALLLAEDMPYESSLVAASEQAITFKNIINVIAAVHNKRVIFLSLPYTLLFFGLKFIELLKIKIGLRSDSLKYMKHYNKSPDFRTLHSTGITFRPFNTSTFQE